MLNVIPVGGRPDNILFGICNTTIPRGTTDQNLLIGIAKQILRDLKSGIHPDKQLNTTKGFIGF
jgi:hypothetical protein